MSDVLAFLLLIPVMVFTVTFLADSNTDVTYHHINTFIVDAVETAAAMLATSPQPTNITASLHDYPPPGRAEDVLDWYKQAAAIAAVHHCKLVTNENSFLHGLDIYHNEKKRNWYVEASLTCLDPAGTGASASWKYTPIISIASSPIDGWTTP